MFFYSDNLEGILKKQNLSQKIEDYLMASRDRQNKAVPGPFFAQLVTTQSISDGVNDFPCQFTCESFRKGSFLRVVRWEVDLPHQRLVVHTAQYLGGSGCDVKHGKKWDAQKLKLMVQSNCYSKNVMVLFEKKPIQPPKENFQEFSFERLKKCFKGKGKDFDSGVVSKRKVNLNGSTD